MGGSMAGARSEPCVGRTDAVTLFVTEAPISMTLVDLEGRYIAASATMLNECDLTREQIIGRSMWDLFPGAERFFQRASDTLAEGSEHYTSIDRVPLSDGSKMWVETRASYWRDDSGEVAGVIYFNRDVTSQKLADRARRDAEALLKAVVDNIPATISVQEPDSERYLLVNARVCEVFGQDREQVTGKLTTEVLSPELAAARTAQIRDLREHGGIQVSEYAIDSGPRAGRILHIKRLFFDDENGRKRLLSIGEDITELRQAAKALEAAVTEADAANAAKSRFLANISHEIRTPLNGVLGMAQAMALEPLPDKQRARLDVIRQSGEVLLTLLNDLLDIAKIEAGKLELEQLEFDLAAMLRETCAAFQAGAEHKKLALQLHLRSEVGRCLGDPTRLRQVVSNLVSNAIKFTESGRIDVVAARMGDEVRFSVADTGLGMSPDVVETMFEKFAQADVSTTRRFGGTGLGLAICRELTELMGGRIAAESVPGEGSRFTFVLPLPTVSACAEPARCDPAAPERRQRPRVLAADDNRVNQLVLTTLLEQAGLDVVVVDNGAEAVEAWSREAWDVILMDVQMPVMDGPAATVAIRRREQAEGRRRTPIVALTANAMAHQTAEYLACGMDAVVAKPIVVEALLNTLDALLPAAADAGAERRQIGA
jgi:PAS domain S-box-containing protein